MFLGTVPFFRTMSHSDRESEHLADEPSSKGYRFASVPTSCLSERAWPCNTEAACHNDYHLMRSHRSHCCSAATQYRVIVTTIDEISAAIMGDECESTRPGCRSAWRRRRIIFIHHLVPSPGACGQPVLGINTSPGLVRGPADRELSLASHRG